MQLALDPEIHRVVGVDTSEDALHRLRRKLHDAPAGVRDKVVLIHGSALDRHPALTGFDAAVLVEMIEHIDPDRLSVVERAVFRHLGPATIVVTTPNREFNGLLGVPGHRLRAPDHRFEWGRAQFRRWAGGVSRRNGFDVMFVDVAGAHPAFGGPTQMAVFKRGPAVLADPT
jgi:SAM-dependent methyltransferase